MLLQKKEKVCKNHTERILFLLNLLSKKSLSKDEILDEFLKQNCVLTKAAIEHYIRVLKANNIKLKVEKQGKQNVYSLCPINTIIKLKKSELEAINCAKRIIRLEKDHTIIRQTLALFYRLALYLDNYEDQFHLVNFGYFSNINWDIVKQLEEHCKNKNVIVIDYILPDCTNKPITIHSDSISISKTSQRLYLNGVIKDTDKFSKLPVDRIFMIEKVLRKNKRFNMDFELLEYTISKTVWKDSIKDDKEFVYKEDENTITIKRPIDNSFEIVQKLLSYCPDLYYISNDDIKRSVIEKLRTIRVNYD